MIAGGQGKGQDFSGLTQPVKDFVKLTVLFGEDGHQIEHALEDCGNRVSVDSLELAVAEAQRVASAGDIVLLSPACASFDMFTGFEHRGRCFREAVTALNTVQGVSQ